MTDAQASNGNATFLRLMTWLSPAFPTGAFAWSSGLESACRNGGVETPDHLSDWLTDGLLHGAMRSDAILCAAAFRGEAGVNELALALAGSKPRYQETIALGDAFSEAAQVWRHAEAAPVSRPIAQPVAVGLLAAEQKLPLQETLIAYLQSSVSSQVQAALRILAMGQQAGLRVTKNLEPAILKTASLAAGSRLYNLGSGTVMMEIACMQHETLESRIFRS